MTPNWKNLVQSIQYNFSVSEISAFSIAMTICLALPILVYALFVWISKVFSGDKIKPLTELFVKYAYGLIPIALFYHIAHNVEHFFVESQKLVVLISDPFGYGWNMFGTAKMQLGSLLTLESIWYTQVGLIIIGHVFGIYISHKHSHRIFENRKAAINSQIPIIGLMVMFSVLSLWLIAQPMAMRTGM